MTAPPVSTAGQLDAFECELLAEYDTDAGNAAWNDGNIRRAISLWKLAALWARLARRARGGA